LGKKIYIYINSFNCSKIKQYTKEQSENCALGIPNMLTIHTNRKLCSWHPKYAHNTYKQKIVLLASQICSQYIQTENCALGIPNMLTIHTIRKLCSWLAPPLEKFWNSRVQILHSGEFWEYLLGCLKEIFVTCSPILY
jgi:hypothetical protein